MYTDNAFIITGIIIIFLLQVCTFAMVSSKRSQHRASGKTEEWYRQQINEKDKSIAEFRFIRDNLLKQNAAFRKMVIQNQENENRRFEDLMRPIEKQMKEAAAQNSNK